jgi:alternate signal-mediated exported protein
MAMPAPPQRPAVGRRKGKKERTMNTDTPTVAPTVVVVTDDRRRRRGLLWVAGAVAALLLGGSTFALWSANVVFSGGTITAGDLNLTEVTDTAFYDVSDDRTDADVTLPGTDGSRQGHAIDSLETWRMVPGDTVAAVFSAEVTLEGDNLVGRLSVSGMDTQSGAPASTIWSTEVYRGGVLLYQSELPADGTVTYLSAPGTGQGAGAEDAKPDNVQAMDQTTETFTVVVYDTFDPDTADRTDVQKADVLASLTLQLDQVRDTGAVFQ